MLGVVDDDLQFAPDLYRGAAEYYDQFRLPYPEAMLTDLVRRAGASGGRLLDLACGTGQLALPLASWFSQVRAVDREPDMISLVRAKASVAGARNLKASVSDAEKLHAEPGSFDLVVIGNAFHRLRRSQVAAQVLEWLTPGGCLALCWSTGPSAGGADWQRRLADLLDEWQTRLGAEDRVPVGWERPRAEHPDAIVLSEAGFEIVGKSEFPVQHRWSVPELAGYVRSTSALPPPVLGDQADEFDASLAAAMGPYAELASTISFAYELARKPSP